MIFFVAKKTCTFDKIRKRKSNELNLTRLGQRHFEKYKIIKEKKYIGTRKCCILSTLAPVIHSELVDMYQRKKEEEREKTKSKQLGKKNKGQLISKTHVHTKK